MKIHLMRSVIWVFLLFFCLMNMPVSNAKADDKILVTVLTASNNGSDYNLDNDAYRDKLIKLFSYSAYNQINQEAIFLDKAEQKIINLIDDYQLALTLQDTQKDRILVRAQILKKGMQFVNTVLSIMDNGVVFVGGPTTDKGALILILERL